MKLIVATLAVLALSTMAAPAFAQSTGSAFNDMWGADYSAAPSNWTGSYIGIAAGYAGASASQSLSVAPFDFAAHSSHADSGATIGGYVGYNYQVDSYVIGAEGTFTYLGQRLGGAIPADLDWQLGLAVRAGFVAQHNTLIYVRAAWALTDIRFANLGELAGTAYTVKDGYRSALQLGAGVDVKLDPNWILRIEGNYTFEGGDAEIIDYTSGMSVKLDPSLYDVRAGLAYQF